MNIELNKLFVRIKFKTYNPSLHATKHNHIASSLCFLEELKTTKAKKSDVIRVSFCCIKWEIAKLNLHLTPNTDLID